MVIKKSRFNRKLHKGGNSCNATATVNNPSCLPTPNVEMYKYPCSDLTTDQFGMPGMGSISLSGGKKSRTQSRNQSIKESRHGSIKNQRHTYNQAGGKTKSELEEELRKLERLYSDATSDPYAPMHAGPKKHYNSSKKSLLKQILDAARKEEQGIAEATAALDQQEALEAAEEAEVVRWELEKQARLEAARKNPLSWRNDPKYGGSCAGPSADCMGSNYDNLGKTAISDGAPTDLPSASELAWFFRNTYGATPSTDVIPQSNPDNTCVQKGGSHTQKAGSRRARKQRGGNCVMCELPAQTGGKKSKKKIQRGGNHFFDLSDKIGGLSRVDNCYDPYPPSLDNLKVNGPLPQDVQVSNVIPYNTQYNGATAQPLLEESSLTRNSFELQGGGNKKKSFLTRNSRNYLFGGSDAGQFPNVYNGAQSDFSPDMLTRKFDCAQPNWGSKCT